MQDAIGRLVAQLQGTQNFEDAALVALRPLLRTTEETIAASSYQKQARALRAVVHVRPDDAYQRLFVLSEEAANAPDAKISGIGAGETGDFVASATAWRVIKEHGAAACLDVEQGTVDVFGTEGLKRIEGPLLDRNPEGSRARYLGRHATHVCVLPLFTPGGSVEGMISIEVECMTAVGQPFIWLKCIEDLRLMAQVAAPHLMTAPLRPSTTAKADELLPVVGRSMGAMLPTFRVFAQHDETLLITGPTGAGKTRFARWCHANSKRKNKPFEMLDLTAVAPDLQLGHLFGWKKGAFTGADRDMPGYLENAKGGTLFIDEIDKLSLAAQAGLLQLIDTRKYRMLGKNDERTADVRFIIGTNAELPAAVSKGLFRSDLYYRINVLPIRMSPLSQRADEIPQWVKYMLQTCHKERGTSGNVAVAPEAERRLCACPWPGNLRQLDNIVRRSYMFALVERAADSQDVTVRERHVAQALAYEAQPDSGRLKEAMSVAAATFVRLAQERPDGIDLALADAFVGFVLGTAIQTLGYKKAWPALKCAHILRQRNDRTRLTKEMERVTKLLQEVDELPSPFDAVKTGESPESDD